MSGCIMKEDARGVSLRVRIQPGASRDEIMGEAEGVLRIRLTARPVEGAANRQCIKFLAKRLHIAKSRITILRGEHAREKVLYLEGIRRDDLRGVLF